MSNITININIPTAYVRLEKYAEMTGTPINTCRGMVSDGRIIIRPKKRAKEAIEVNLVAMLKDAIANS
ncbi:TPA: DNA-binding protein [Salmonella enterica subsp. enterica serovar Enteritidis]|nr:DNA-binding protein [Salmonella enterica subsp. enterica]EEG3093034.1 DNA-binding protein [Salmonella enterica]EHD0027053.1 DNA-binding protein [Salmonella enterica subsp. houtenae serovar 50:g,z51:-]